ARVEDALHAFAYLAQRPEADPRRLGVKGLSLGGPIAVALAAAEPRARAVVSVSGPGNVELLLRSLRTGAFGSDRRPGVRLHSDQPAPRRDRAGDRARHRPGGRDARFEGRRPE